MNQLTLLIPSYCPPTTLPELCRTFLSLGFKNIIVINDGSPQKYSVIFSQLRSMNLQVLDLPHNMGKGNALKAGFTYALAQQRDSEFFACCDDDGQHHPQDVWRVVQVALTQRHPFVLGTRTFDSETPWKSFLGNKVMSLILRLRFAISAPDSQSGLRCFRRDIVEQLLLCPGERFGFEMLSLIKLYKAGIPFYPVPIQTIYFEKNRLTRFRVWEDSRQVIQIALGLSRFKD